LVDLEQTRTTTPKLRWEKKTNVGLKRGQAPQANQKENVAGRVYSVKANGDEKKKKKPKINTAASPKIPRDWGGGTILKSRDRRDEKMPNLRNAKRLKMGFLSWGGTNKLRLKKGEARGLDSPLSTRRGWGGSRGGEKKRRVQKNKKPSKGKL